MEGSKVTKYRSDVGKLLFVAEELASLMRKPPKAGWRYLRHVVSSNLLGAKNEGILLECGPKGRSMLHASN